jgi:hypothetical protein
MVNYRLGKVYKIVGNGKIYIGSTCKQYLCQRLAGHNGSYKLYQKGKGGNMTSFQCLTDPYHYIELLELCPCESKDELFKCERKWIEQIDCVNRCIVGRTDKEYAEDNKEKIQTYREANKEKINEQRKVYREANKEKIKTYREANEQKIKEQIKAYQLANKDKINEQRRIRRLQNKDG